MPRLAQAHFRRAVWAHYKKHGRHALPWRKTRNPYRILVSEIMLQQTQVDRVISFYKAFLKQFPTPKTLAEAPLSDVLVAWQGLGYNRRAKMLHSAAKEIAKNGMPKTATALEQLPGVGPYTAAAVAAFAYNEDGVVIETNIRTAVMHHFFPRRKKVSDVEIRVLLEHVLPKGEAREWYSALMDYGAHLKASGVQVNQKSKHYTKQKAFSGSNREARGAILRALARSEQSATALANLLGRERRAQLLTAREALLEEGMIQKRGRIFILPR